MTKRTSLIKMRARNGSRNALRLGGAAVFAAMLLFASPGAASANQTPQALPFNQDWSNAGLITVNDNWTGVAGIEGFLGQDITTGTGADPQTLVTSSALATDLDVIANQATPNTNTSGGVAEFAISNPTIALQGSGTADTPYTLITLDTTSASSINVAYNLRDIDGSADNAVQPVALQYRVGTSGNFTNVPGGFVADASTGPSLATAVTAVGAILPPAADNQGIVQVRIITANAVGSDEWIGIDDIVVTSGGVAVETAPSVTSSVPTNNATNVAVGANVTVTFSESVSATGAFAATCTISGPRPLTVTGGPSVWTLDPDADFVPGESCSVTVTASLVTDTDTIDPPDAMAADYLFSFATVATAPCTAPFTPIYAIQGSGSAPAITGITTTKGVVVGDYEVPVRGNRRVPSWFLHSRRRRRRAHQHFRRHVCV